MKLLNIFCLFFLFNNFCYSQVNGSEKKNTSEIVFLKDLYLRGIIKEIVKKDNLCLRKDVQWSIELMKDNVVVITKYSLENLIASKGIANIYTTIIDDEIMFISIKDDINADFTKSGYSVDLMSFKNKENFSTIDYSFWVIQKKDGKKYKIIKEKKYSCN